MSDAPRRSILFLQGPTSRLWRELGIAFETRGHAVHKINLCVSDQLYWRRFGSRNYRGRLGNWKKYLTAVVAEEGVTDILYYADRLPYHRIAAEVAREAGAMSYVIENGYLRPDWISLEWEGMSAYSHFPTDPQLIRAIAAACDDPNLTIEYPHTFEDETFNEMFYHLTTLFFPYPFPFYRSDKYYNPLIDYWGGFRRQRVLAGLKREADRVVSELLQAARPFYLVALQTQGDYQIRDNSPYRHQLQMIEEVIASFAEDAPADCSLVFKIHPHDNGLEKWAPNIGRLAQTRAIQERVFVIDGGSLDALLRAARGVVMINSTVGMHAIRLHCPVKVLGAAIYDVPGLTHQGPLATFWVNPEPIDRSLASDFVRALAGTIQVKGSFYNRAGREAAIKAIVDRIERGIVRNLPPSLPRLPRTDKISDRAAAV